MAIRDFLEALLRKESYAYDKSLFTCIKKNYYTISNEHQLSLISSYITVA